MNRKKPTRKSNWFALPLLWEQWEKQWDYECKNKLWKTGLRFLFMLSHLWWSECLGLLILKSAHILSSLFMFRRSKSMAQDLKQCGQDYKPHLEPNSLLHQSPFPSAALKRWFLASRILRMVTTQAQQWQPRFLMSSQSLLNCVTYSIYSSSWTCSSKNAN